MESILLPAAISIAVFITFMIIFQKFSSSKESLRKNDVINKISRGSVGNEKQNDQEADLLKRSHYDNRNILLKLPGVQSTLDLLLASGLWSKRWFYVVIVIGLFTVLSMLLKVFGLIGIIASVFIAYVLPRIFLKNIVSKRKKQFLDAFPDAIDMISRSVRSGHPLGSAMKMIVENIDGPLAEEFKQVVDETMYGRSLTESLKRMSDRVGEADINFFVVALAVQQETGGSLTEVLGNLSTIIRKRKMLRMKIRALTSEGRMTAWILGAIPVLEFGMLYYTAPEYMSPLFTNPTGHWILGGAIALIISAVWVVNLMVDIEV